MKLKQETWNNTPKVKPMWLSEEQWKNRLVAANVSIAAARRCQGAHQSDAAYWRALGREAERITP